MRVCHCGLNFCPAFAEMVCGGVYGMPEKHTETQVRDALRGAAEAAQKVRDSAPCDEHRQAIDEASDLLRGVAQEIEDVGRR